MGLKENQTTEDSSLHDSASGLSNSDNGGSGADAAPQNVPRMKVYATRKIGIGKIDFDQVVLRKTGAPKK